MYTVIEWGYYICCMLCMIAVGEWTYQWTNKSKKHIVLATILYVTGFVLCFILTDKGLSVFYFVEMLAWGIICKADWKKKVVILPILSFVVGLTEGIIALLTDELLGRAVRHEIRQLIGIVLTFLLWALIARGNWYVQMVKKISSISRLKKIMLVFAVITSVSVVSYGYALHIVTEYSMTSRFFGMLIIVEACVVIAIIVWVVNENYQKKYFMEQNALKEEIIWTQRECYKVIYEKDKKMRSFRHDIVNQLKLLRIILDQGDVQKAKEHLNQVYQEFSEASFQKISVGNEVLDAILSMMNQKAQEHGIEIEFSGNLQGMKEVAVYELCTIFSNALSNAIEACDKTEKEKIINVKLLVHNETIICRIENPATKEMYHNVMEERTSKQDKENHGYGVQNIKRAVTRMNGKLEYLYNEGKIILEIYM